MHIFGAQLQAKPGRGGALAAALGELKDVASSVVGQPAYAWAVIAGAPTGSFALSTRMDGTADLISTLMTLNANEDYQRSASAIGDLLATPSQTSWVRVHGMAGDVGDPKPVVTVTSATVAGGHMSAAMTWSNEVLEHAASVTGLGIMLGATAAGSFFDVAFISGADSGKEVDDANDALMADAGYAEHLDRAKDLFVDGSANRVVMAQLP